MSAQEERDRTLAALTDHLLVGVIRSNEASHATALFEGVLQGGFRAVEITATTPEAFSLVRRHAQPNRLLGIGTVRSIEDIDRAIDAQACFVVSPHTDPHLIAHARSAGLITIPGAMTPTEIIQARAAGADAVKVFPVSAVGGPSFVRWLRGPLPDVPLWVSGNVSLDEISAFIDAGVSLIGLTSALTGVEGPDIQGQAQARAEQALAIRDRTRTGAPLLTVARAQREVQLNLSDIRKLPPEEFCPLETVVPGRTGHAVRLRHLLSIEGSTLTGTLRLTSVDGFTREVTAQDLVERGFLHFSTDGGPLTASDGGPLRLYIRGPQDRCDNVKGLCRIEVFES